MVEALDSEVGRLLAGVDFSDTVVMVAGDNGTKGGLTLGSPERRAKGSLFEGGINVPLIVAGPVVAKAHRGQVTPAFVGLIDVYATVAELAGVAFEEVLPPDYPIDSRSMLPVLKDPEHGSIRNHLYSEKFFPAVGPPYDEVNGRMLRNKQYKYIRNVLDRADDGLYDLAAAPEGKDGQNLLGNLILPPHIAAARDELSAKMDELAPDRPAQ
jgi:arylsulfatase A-like enzyme